VSRSTVADVLADGLRRAGTRRLFAVADGGDGHAVLDAASAAGLAVTFASTEAGACVMAAVTGDLTDSPGAVLIRDLAPDVGPAVAAAVGDRAPMIVLTSGASLALAGCKETLGVEPKTVAHRIAHAARLSMAIPRGPVQLDVAAEIAGRSSLPVATSCRPDSLPYPASESLDRAAEALVGATRPLLLTGLHCRSDDAAQWLRAFAEALPAPVIASPRAKGVIPDPHPLMLGVLGLSGAEERLLSRADVVVAIGLDAPLEPMLATSARVLAFGPAQPADDRGTAVQVVGDVSAVIEELAARLRDKPRADWDVAELDRLRRENAGDAGNGLAARLVRLAREACPAGTIATVDAGARRAAVTGAWHATAPREFLTSSAPEGTGFALPAAIAARLVHPDRRVVCFTDAALMATAHELETAVRLATPVVIVVFEDAAPGAVTRQLERYGVSVSVAENEPTFARALGEALGIAGPSLIVVTSRTPV